MIATPNTDNKGHLFVTDFEHPASMTNLQYSISRDTLSCSPSKKVHLDKFLAPIKLVP